jgi:serine/threonine protein phosphatase 1
MPKLFVCSDIHSFYTPLKKALDDKGFDPNNKNHWLVVCGDVFDRGDESEEVLHFLMSLERKILIKGNHDTLLDDCCLREFPYRYDTTNGTRKTIQDLGGAKYERDFAECCCRTWDRLAEYRRSLVNYFETKNYIFVHSWIPLIIENDYAKYYTRDKEYYFNPDWRNATEKEWEDAMWGNPFELAEKQLLPDKTIVFGHFHTSYQWNKSSNCSEFGEDAIFQPYYGNKYIGIDACTAHTGKCNVIVLEDDFIK